MKKTILVSAVTSFITTVLIIFMVHAFGNKPDHRNHCAKESKCMQAKNPHQKRMHKKVLKRGVKHEDRMANIQRERVAFNEVLSQDEINTISEIREKLGEIPVGNKEEMEMLMNDHKVEMEALDAIVLAHQSDFEELKRGKGKNKGADKEDNGNMENMKQMKHRLFLLLEI